MNADQIRKRLRQYNPLASVAAADPWATRWVDVPVINRLPFEGVTRLVHQIARAPGEPLAALVLGEVGNGKSHLVSRLRLACRQGKWPGEFALVTPPESGATPFCYLLREIADSLRVPMPGKDGLSAWHQLAAGLIAKGMNSSPWREAKSKPVRKLLKSMKTRKKDTSLWWKKIQAAPFLNRFSPAALDLVEILVRWLPSSPDGQREALAWLRGESRETEILPARFSRSSDNPEAIETQSRDLLIALGELLAYFHRPLLVCFDRMEDLRSPGQHAAMDLMLTFLVDRMSATLPVVFVRGQFWEELRLDRWNAQTVSRVESNRFEMTGCSRTEAEALIQGRLERVLGQEGMANLFFDPAALLETLPPGRHTPRIVLTLANRCLQALLDLPLTAAENPETRLAEAWESLTTRFRTRIADEPTRPERLVQALRLYLLGEQALPLEAEEEGRIELPADNGQPAQLWLVEMVFHPRTIIQRLAQAESWWRRHPDGLITYVRDGRQPIPQLPKWPETNQILHRFRERGGRMLPLPAERIVRWHALGELHDAIRCGEITWLDGQNREHPVPMPMLIDFLHHHFAAEQNG
ncbi:MAG: hypothetical protein HQL99_13695 [Magnetococcales bacterium]|nr:hypothetical protein [Magnetococcales bacterium]